MGLGDVELALALEEDFEVSPSCLLSSRRSVCGEDF